MQLTSTTRKRSGGFTALELLVTISVMAVIMALALPQYVASRKTANETAAISALRAISSANALHRSRYGIYGTIGDLQGQDLIDETLSGGDRHGYLFESIGSTDDALWAVVAEPSEPGTSGDRYFYVDESGVIRFAPNSGVDDSSSVIQ